MVRPDSVQCHNCARWHWLKPTELPVVFIVKTATGQNSTKAHIYMESYYTDSVTGQTLGEVIQAATGKSVSGKEITIDNLKAALDKWAKKAAEAFTSARDSKG